VGWLVGGRRREKKEEGQKQQKKESKRYYQSVRGINEQLMCQVKELKDLHVLFCHQLHLCTFSPS
jgi:hypothetical protein